MTAQEMWELFVKQNPDAANRTYDAWCYGDAPDELAELTRKGIKSATASAYPVYELEGESLPEEGGYNIILDSNESAVCITRTERVFVLPFREVTEVQAFREGEGDRSLAYWQEVHRRFFTEELTAYGLEFSEDMDVVCEEFQMVFSL